MKEKRSAAVIGIILVFIGGIFLITQFIPQLKIDSLWPLFVLGAGIIFLFFGFIRNHGLLIPGCIVSYVGFVLIYQNISDNWNFWQLWLLVPTAVGIGIFLNETFEKKNPGKAFSAAWVPILIGITLFLIFSTSLSIKKLWPAIIILIGIVIFIQGLFSANRKKSNREEDAYTIENDNDDDRE